MIEIKEIDSKIVEIDSKRKKDSNDQEE